MAEKERFSRFCRPLASHSRLASQIICSQYSLLWLLRCTKTSHRDVFDCSLSRRPVALTNSNLSHQRKKDTVWCPFRWRRRRDLNSRAGYIRPTPLAGAPLRPLEYFSTYFRELPLPFRSRPIIISYFQAFVNSFF